LIDAGTTCTPGTTVTVAVADLVGSACDVAVTVACGGFGMVVGAVYSPVGEIAPPGEVLQVTPVFGAPVTFATNCCDWLAGTVAVVGETDTDIGPEGAELPPPHPRANVTKTAKQQLYL